MVTENQQFEAAKEWLDSIQLAQNDKKYQSWCKKSRKILDLYTSKQVYKQSSSQFNILWSNIAVLFPALYGQKPRPEVVRRFKDRNPVSRTAALILQRCLQYEIDRYDDFNSAMEYVVKDRLLPGRGIAWVRFEPNFSESESTVKEYLKVEVNQDVEETISQEENNSYDAAPQITEDIPQSYNGFECTPCDYVHWEDFLTGFGRTWEEIPWVARRVWMTEDDIRQRFEDLTEKEIKSLSYTTDYPDNGYQKGGGEQSANDEIKEEKAEIWEIWDKETKTVCWVSKDSPFILDKRDDPLKLDDFFPCPKPLCATLTSESFIPVPDYCIYEEQAQELNKISERITMLTKALRVAGIYNASMDEIRTLLSSTDDNMLVPVDNWGVTGNTGLKGSIDFVPIEMIANVLNQLYVSREQIKQVIYEIVGISDILRGVSDSKETLGAQQLKTNFGSLRLRPSQKDVARFANAIFNIKAQLICRFFRDETIYQMSGIENTSDAEHFYSGLSLLRSNLRDFNISVGSDVLAEIDEGAEKRDRIEYVNMVGTFLEKAYPVMQQDPQSARLLGEMLLFAIRGFKVGSTIESYFEEAIDNMQQGPNVAQLQQQMQAMQQQLSQLEQENAQLKSDVQSDMVSAQAKAQLDRVKTSNDLQIKQAESLHDMQLKEVQAQMDMMLKEKQMDNQNTERIN